jgi:hypothetical protein
MSDQASKQEPQETEQEASVNEQEVTASAHRESPPGSFLPTVFSGIAVLLAVAALAFTLYSQHKDNADSMQDTRMQAINMKLDQVEARIGGMEAQLAGNKVDAAHMQLNRILFELQQVSTQVDAATRSKIEQAYRTLKPLSPTSVKEKIELGTTAQGTPATSTEGKNPSASSTKPSTTPEPSPDQTQALAPASGQPGETTDSQPSAGAEEPTAADNNAEAAKPAPVGPSGAPDNANTVTSGTTQDASPSEQGHQDTAPTSGAPATTQ